MHINERVEYMTAGPDRGLSRLPKIVFVLGLMHRCGTNHLLDILIRHPDVGAPVNLPEDFVVSESRQLLSFGDALKRRWHEEWGGQAMLLADLERQLGSAVTQMIANNAHRDSQFLITKTPSVENLDLLFRFWPTAKVIILVRDGRDATESAHRTFGVPHDLSMKRWSDRAKIVRNFCEAHADRRHQWRIVQYEDLVRIPNETIKRVSDFIGLDSSKFKDDLTIERTMIGSSSEPGSTNSRKFWQAKPASKDWSPVGRASSWSKARLARYAWVAGDVHEQIGYQLPANCRSTGIATLWQRLLDIRLSFLFFCIHLVKYTLPEKADSIFGWFKKRTLTSPTPSKENTDEILLGKPQAIATKRPAVEFDPEAEDSREFQLIS